MIEVKNLSAAYDGIPVFSDLNFSLADSSFTALCGKNGSGKSTLLSLMTGIIPTGLKYTGDILIDGKSVFKEKRNLLAQKVSLLLQSEAPAWNLSVRQFVETGLYSYGRMPQSECRKAVDEALEKIGISDFADKKIFNISGGEFQKCRLARCFVQKTPLMLFDEPAEKLDLPFQLQFLEQIQKLGKTILFSIHDINLAALFAQDYLLISKGSLIQGKTDQIFTPELLSAAFSASTTIYTHPLKNVPQVLFN
ncbi:MAG: ABC transporter ATP-binding protein [Treponema sp.]|nr:ABC transporter ATP-binding protein [Treponema sp.]